MSHIAQPIRPNLKVDRGPGWRMDQETFSGVKVGSRACWGQGHDLILLGHASNGRHIPGVSEACTLLWTLLVLGSMSLGYPLSHLGLLIRPYNMANGISNFF